jgi:hypothetical protein
MKFLDPVVHGILDYLAVLALALAPVILDFGGLPATICYIVAVVHLVVSLLTAYPLGLAKVIPFRLHGGIELLTAIFLLIAPSLLDFSIYDSARPFFAVAGLVLGVAYALTNYRAVPDPYRSTGMYRERVWTH